MGKSIAYIVILLRGSSCCISPDAAAAKHPFGIPGPVVRKCLQLVSLDLALGGGPWEIVDHLDVARQLEGGQFGGGPAQQRLRVEFTAGGDPHEGLDVLLAEIGGDADDDHFLDPPEATEQDRKSTRLNPM